MARHPDLPRAAPVVLHKTALLNELSSVDNDSAAKQRIYQLEGGFKAKINAHIASMRQANASFCDFNTSPFVLMIFALKNHYTKISEIEGDILPAKLFSSMETSAGKMVEEVVLPVYGWAQVHSAMHTANSVLDGWAIRGSDLLAVTLKSGPACLNDGMVGDIANEVLQYGSAWVASQNAKALKFTYGVLYGTKKQSNKKDWHILRRLYEALGPAAFTVAPRQRWDCRFKLKKVPVEAVVRVGREWWDFLGGTVSSTCLMEICIALIRACVAAGAPDPQRHSYTISDLSSLVALPSSLQNYNVGLLQQNQLPWLFLLMAHFCDQLHD